MTTFQLTPEDNNIWLKFTFRARAAHNDSGEFFLTKSARVARCMMIDSIRDGRHAVGNLEEKWHEDMLAEMGLTLSDPEVKS